MKIFSFARIGNLHIIVLRTEDHRLLFETAPHEK